jgi:hypothetical protein
VLSHAQLDPATWKVAPCLTNSWQCFMALDSPLQQRFKEVGVGGPNLNAIGQS